MAFYKYFWDLSASTTYSSHVIGAFDKNTTTGGGIFRWVSGVNNSTISNIPGIRIKPTNSLTGYWLRSFDGPISVSWFGCQNGDSIPNTFAQVGVSQLVLDSYYGPGFATTTDNYDTTAIRYAMKFMDDSLISTTNIPGLVSTSLVFEPKKYWLTRGVTLPSGLSNINPGMFVIDGNSAQLYKAVNTQFDMFNRYPTGIPQSYNFVTKSFTIKNFIANGGTGVWQGSGYSFLTLGSATNCLIENISLDNFDIGIRMEHCPNSIVRNIRLKSTASYGIRVTSGGWVGATNTGTSSSNFVITDVEIINTLSTLAHIYVNSVDNLEIEHIRINGSPGGGSFVEGIVVDGVSNMGNKKCRIYDVMADASITNAVPIWQKSIVTIKPETGVNSTNFRYVLDSIWSPANGSLGPDACLINVENVDPNPIPGRKPIIELRNIAITSVYPSAPTLPNTGGNAFKFRNVGENLWSFLTVDFGNDPSVDSAAIIDPLNLLWITTAPATIPVIDDVVFNNPVTSCCPIQLVLDAGQDITDGLLFIGTGAGEANTGANDVVALGTDAANGNAAVDLIAIGNSAASGNTAYDVIALGKNALFGNTGTYAISIGRDSGYLQTGDTGVFIGSGAGYNNAGVDVVAIGVSAGNANTGDKLHAMGVLAGAGNTGDYVVAVGSGAAQTNTVNYVIALGNAAGANNAIPNSTIISNDCLPSYLNYTAASTAISGPGATPGTYLYHDQTTNSIGAVRIP